MTEQEESDLIKETKFEILNLTSRCIEFREENAKLRRLVSKLYACQKYTDCTDCPYFDDPSCYFKDDLRELGIEVN